MLHRHKGHSLVLKASLAAIILAIGTLGYAETGISDTQIILGNASPQSGPNAAYGTSARAARACFQYINEDFGGIKMGDGKTRKVEYITYDDAMEPARALQSARRLVSQDNVFATIGNVGTGASLATRSYYNSEKVPQLFVFSGGPMFGSKEDVEKFPWSMGGLLAYNTEAAIYAAFIKDQFPNAKVALLNDNSGGPFFAKGFLKAAKDLGLNIVIHEEHTYSDPTIDAKIDRMAASGADVFVDATVPKYVVQALKRMNTTKWAPKHIIWGVGASIAGALLPAGADISKGVYSGLVFKDAASTAFSSDADMKLYKEKLKKYDSGLNPADSNAAIGWFFCGATKIVLENTKQPTRSAFMDAARHMSHVKAPLLLDGITLTTNGADDGYPIESAQMGQFDGAMFSPIGKIISYEGKTPAP